MTEEQMEAPEAAPMIPVGTMPQSAPRRAGAPPPVIAGTVALDHASQQAARMRAKAAGRARAAEQDELRAVADAAAKAAVAELLAARAAQ